MDIKKRMGIYMGIFLVIFGFLTWISKDNNNYIFISTNQESVDIFNKNKEEISLYKKNDNSLEKIKLVPYVNGFISLEDKIGDYLVEVKEDGNLSKSYLMEKESNNPLEIFLRYIPKSDVIGSNIFFNVLTITFLFYNISLLWKFKEEILRKKDFIFLIGCLLLKISLTNSEIFSNISLARANMIVTSIFGLYLLLYTKSKSYNLKGEKLINISLWILFLAYYIGEVVVLSSILDIKILSYLAKNYLKLFNITVFFYIWVDAIIIILIMLLLVSMKTKKKDIIKKIEKKNLLMIGSFITLSFMIELFLNNNKYFYYLNMFEFVFMFWYVFLTDINTVGKVETLTLKIFQMFLHIYIFFIMTESVWIAIGIIVSFTVLNIFTNFIKGTLRINKSYIENLINRMYLTKNYIEFKEQLSKELKKNLELVNVDTKILTQRDDYKKFLTNRVYDESEVLIEKCDILDKKYDYALRLKYNKNPFIALILIENRGLKLVYEEKRYLEEISEKVSVVASRYRIEKLQEELS